MSIKLQRILCIVIIIVSLIGIYSTIKYEEKKESVQEITLLDEKDSRVINTITIKLSVIEIIIIFIFVLLILLTLYYLFLYKSINMTKYSNYIYFIIPVISIIITVFISYMVNNYILVTRNEKVTNVNQYVVSPTASLEITKDSEYTYKKFITYDKNKSAILIKGDTNVDIYSSTINKYGNNNDLFVSNLYGINSAILVLKDSTLNINSSVINTNGDGASGITSVLENSNINIDVLTIETMGKNSSGLMASLNGNITGSNIKIKTTSINSPTIRSVSGGIINIDNAILESNAKASALLEVNGKATLLNSNGDANASNAVIIDGKSTVNIDSCEFRVTGNRKNNNSYDGAFIIDKNYLTSNATTNSELTINNSSIEIKKQSKVYDSAPLFIINSNNSVINLSNNKYIYGSNIFLDAFNTYKDKNMLVKLNSSDEKIYGDINADNSTVLEIVFNNTDFKGSINSKNSAKKITLDIDKKSNITLTDNIYVTIINNADKKYSNIDSNGYNIYYKKDENTSLSDIKLSGGGKLIGY